jgi:hypothetical protein
MSLSTRPRQGGLVLENSASAAANSGPRLQRGRGNFAGSLAAFFAWAAILVALALKTVWTQLVFVFPSWNDVRLRPSFQMWNGSPVYPGLDEGPITTWMYGPANPLALLPATWSADYITCLRIAAAINTLLWLVPVILLICFWPRDPAAEKGPSRVLLAASCCLAMPPTLLAFITADATCSAFSLVSLLTLALHLRDRKPAGMLWLSALAVTTAAFAKPHGAVLAVAQVLFLAWSLGPRFAASHALRIALFILCWLLVCVSLSATPFSWWQHIVTIPAGLPWTPDLLAQAAREPVWMIFAILLPLVVSVLTLKKNTRGPRALVAFCFLLVLPFSLSAFFKYGGNTNSLHPALYLLALLPGLHFRNPAFAARAFLALACAAALALAHWTRGQLAQLPPLEILREARNLAGLAPSQLWLPWRPTAQFLASGQHTHDEDGLHVRFIVGLPPTEKRVREGLPPEWNAAAIERHSMRWGVVEALWHFESILSVGKWTMYVGPGPSVPAPQVSPRPASSDPAQ